MDTKVLIIGAGPYAIGLAYELQRLKVPFIVVGKPFAFWHDHVMTKMNLRSDPQASEIFTQTKELDWQRYLQHHSSAKKVNNTSAQCIAQCIGVTEFRKYTNWVLKQLPYKPLTENIVHLEKKRSGFLVRTESGTELTAKNVVIATGVGSHYYLPNCLQALPESLVQHSYFTKKYEHFVDQDVLVIGGGQSAAETVTALFEHNNLTWLHRSPLLFSTEALNLPKPLLGVAHKLAPFFYYCPDVVRKVFEKSFTAASIMPNFKDKLMAPDMRRLQGDVAALHLTKIKNKIFSTTLNKSFDHVVACTGYRYQLSKVQFLDDKLRKSIAVDNDVPRLQYNFSTSVNGLFMVGGIAEPSHGPAMRFMLGSRQAILAVSSAVRKK